MKIFLAVSFVILPATMGWAQSCVPPNDTPSACPQKYMPAPGVPSAAEKAAVTSAMVKAQNAANLVTSLKAKINGYRNAGGDPTPGLKDLAEKDSDRYLAEFLIALKNLQNLQVENFRFHNEAIQLAIAAYHLTPPKTDLRESVDSPLPWDVKTWVPHYSENEIQDSVTKQWRMRTPAELKLEAGNMSFVANGMNVQGSAHCAATLRNGEMVLLRNLFEDPQKPGNANDPDAVALLIYHETTHWVATAASSGRRASDPPARSYRGEAQAYANQADFAHKLALSADPAHKPSLNNQEAYARMLSRQYDKQAVIVNAENLTWEQIPIKHRDWLPADPSGVRGNVLPSGSDPAGSAQPEKIHAGGDASFLTGLDDLRRLAADTKRQADRDNDAAQARQKAERDESAQRFREKLELEARAKKYLWAIARAACADPAEMAARDGKNQAVSMAHLLPGDGIMGSYAITDTSGPGSLSGCQAGVLDDFDAARRNGRRVTSADFAQWARNYREAHPGILKRLAGGVSGAFSGVRDALGGLLGFLDSVDSEGDGADRSERTSRSSGGGDDSADVFRRSMAAQNKELSKYDAIIHKVYAGADGSSFDGNKASKVTP